MGGTYNGRRSWLPLGALSRLFKVVTDEGRAEVSLPCAASGPPSLLAFYKKVKGEGKVRARKSAHPFGGLPQSLSLLRNDTKLGHGWHVRGKDITTYRLQYYYYYILL
jgi:hypothetical protein